MYQPDHLDSFLRLLISHLGTVLTQGEQLAEWQSNEMRLDMLQYAIEQGQGTVTHQKTIEELRDCEALFVLQMSQSREWVDRLGQLDPQVERDTDEFLAATFSIEKLLQDHCTRKKDYRLENRLTRPGNNRVLRDEFSGDVDVEMMMGAIFELLGRLEEQYDLMDELLDVRQVVNGVPFGRKYTNNGSARIIPLFARQRKVFRQDNECG
jgi:hypothetical protein